ncbi:MAG: cytochrome C, partial [Comamonadaceae bacterium]|nr:cytochrome C [Comamonadaceae bacterium]
MKPRQLVVALGLAGGLLATGASAAPDAAALARGEQVYA